MRPPLPPFSFDTASQKVRMGEDAWNFGNPEKSINGIYRRQYLAQSSRIF